MNEILGYLGAILIGVVLGLVGGGGSILTVPILTYLFFINPVTATAYSLFVVGATSLVGTIRNIKKGLVDFKIGIVFAIPAFCAVYLTRKFLIPSIPEVLITTSNFQLTKNVAIMTFFAVIMLLAAFSMIKNRRASDEGNENKKLNIPFITAEGFVVGFVTGIVGAGGGFIIIPALVVLAKLPMKKAVATSLLIIAFKSLIGFIGDVENSEINWSFLFGFTSLSIIGIFLGIYLSNFIEGKKLKIAFGYFVLVMAIFILFKEL